MAKKTYKQLLESVAQSFGLPEEHPYTVAEALKRWKRNAEARGRDEAMKSLGLKKVKGAQGGIYWE